MPQASSSSTWISSAVLAPDDLEEAGIEVPDEVVPALQSGRRLHALVAAARRLRSSREHGD